MNKNIVLFALLVLCAAAAYGQKDPIMSMDSLRTVWKDVSRPDTTRFKALQEVVFQRKYTAPPDSLLALVREMIAFTHGRGMKKQEATAWNLAGVFHNNLNQWDSAEVAYLNSLRMWEALDERGRMAGCYNNLGNVASYKGDQAKAIEYLTNSLRMGEEMGDSSVIARALGNIGICHFEQQEYDVALDYFHRRIAVADAIGDKQCSLEAYICIGMLHDERNEPALAREGYVNCLRIAREIGDVTSIYVTLNALGTGYVAEGDYQRGLTYLDSSLALASEHGDPAYESSGLAEIAHAHHLQGKDAKALPFAQQALAKAWESGVQEGVRDAAEVNYEVLKALGNEREALEMHELYIATRDSMTNDENKKAVMSHRFQYEYEKKEALLSAEQEKKDAIAAEELRRKNVQRNAFIGGFGLMVLLAGVFFVQRNRINKEKKRSEDLLLNILPEEVAEELKAKGSAEAVHIDQVTVLFTDFKGFTAMSEVLTPKDLVRDLHECFSAFDHICEKHRLEKIKTIGDAYMAAGGLPTPNTTHATDVIHAALEMRDFIAEGKARKIAAGLPYFEIRIGIHTGPVVAGIVGVKKFQYDIWGDTVNTASRMESSGEVGQVNISEATYALVREVKEVMEGRKVNAFAFTPRGKVKAKGKGELEMYFVRKG
ncbi:MAG: adenylate/guanylate cyclase domain-containing protein [Flavobacteriales bacterium]